MPGFVIYSTEANSTSVPKRVLLKHQWYIDKLGPVRTSPNSPSSYAKDITLPKFSVDEEVVEGGAIKYKFAKMIGWDDVRVTFYDTDGLIGDLEGWRNSVFAPDTGIGLASDYKQASRFILTDGQNNALVTITLQNSWPKQIGYGELSYTESDAKLVDLTLSYDYPEIVSGAIS